jgi:hypothetical protein
MFIRFLILPYRRPVELAPHQALVATEGREHLSDPSSSRLVFPTTARNGLREFREPAEADQFTSLQLVQRANNRHSAIEVGSDRRNALRLPRVHQAQQPGFHDIIGMMPERDVACAPCVGGLHQSPSSGSSAGKTVERQLF